MSVASNEECSKKRVYSMPALPALSRPYRYTVYASAFSSAVPNALHRPSPQTPLVSSLSSQCDPNALSPWPSCRPLSVPILSSS